MANAKPSRVVGPSLTAGGREQIGWWFYDWANSAFATTVVTVFLGPYLTTVTRAAADSSGFVHPLGVPIHAGAFFPYLVSLSVLLQIVVLPILGAIADYTHLKKQMLALFAYVGAFTTMGLYFLSGTNYLLGGGLFVVANVSFGASIVIYNAFLPQIAGPDWRNFVSSLGWGLGYLGGGLLLALNLALFSRAGSLGLTTGEAVRISLLSAGMWWALFTIVPLATLRNPKPAGNAPMDVRIIVHGFRQLRHTFRQVRHYPQTLTFLVAYLLYNDGIQTVIALSTVFGQEELGIDIATLTTVILMVQFIGFFGTLLFHRIAATIGTKRAIASSLLIWTGTLIFAFGFMWTTSDFFILAGVIALVLGGSQALSRSAFSMMIPPGEEAEYFSLYEVSERGTSWLGPLVFGLSLQFTGSYRIAILSLIVFFVAGLAFLTRVDIRRGAVEAGNQAPSLG